MPFEKPNWKQDWDRAKGHYEQWWQHEGPLLTIVGLPALDVPWEGRVLPEAPKDPRQRHLDPHWFAFCQFVN